jgi:MFS family permease
MTANRGPTLGLRSMGRALSHRNFRLFFGGQGISLIGTWMTRIATSWLVYLVAPQRETAPVLLGVVGFAGQIPAFFLSPLAGVLVDRWNRRRLLLVTQFLAMMQSFLLATVAATGQSPHAIIWQVIVLSAFQGLINSFDMPGRQAFLVEMVEEREDLANAIALNSSLVNGARLIGPSIAGLIIAWSGVFWCFLIDGLSYLAVIASLVMMRVAARPAGLARPPLWQGLKEGLRYALGFPPIRSLLLLMSLVSLMGMSYTVLMPIFSSYIRADDATILGFLMAASGVGALAGALYLAARNSVLGLGRIIVLATLLLGAGLIVFGLSRSFWLSMVMMLLTGFGTMVQMAATNTVLQTIVEEDKRGRVMSLYTVSFLGIAPFGSLLIGGLASALGAALAVQIGGLCCIAGGLLFALRLPRLRQQVRPIYVRMGILPELATGIQAASSLTLPPED